MDYILFLASKMPENSKANGVEYISVRSDNEDYATVDTIIVEDKTDLEIPISYRVKRFVNICLHMTLRLKI